MGLRRQAREAALQAVFMCDFLGQWDAGAVHFCFDHFNIPKPLRTFSTQLAEGVIANIVKIDAHLTCASEHWSLSRMARVDRSILRVATFEIAFLEEIPINVAINEAIEIAKRYGSDESPHFVNGVLDRVASLVRPHQKAARQAASAAALPPLEVIRAPLEPLREEGLAAEDSAAVGEDDDLKGLHESEAAE